MLKYDLHTYTIYSLDGAVRPIDAISKNHTMAYGRCSLQFFHVLTTALLVERRVVKPGRPSVKS